MLQSYTTTLEVYATDWKRGFQYTDWYKIFLLHKSSTDMTNQQKAFKAVKRIPPKKKNDNKNWQPLLSFSATFVICNTADGVNNFDPYFDSIQ